MMEYPFVRREMSVIEYELEKAYLSTVPIKEYKYGEYKPLWKRYAYIIDRMEVGKEKYDEIIEMIAKEVKEQKPEQYRVENHYEVRAKEIYQNTYKKYISEFAKLFETFPR